MNASIEAARAGEFGHGFSNVADEVRKQAERSAMATKEISAIISDTQHETRDAIEAIEQGLGYVNDGMQRATFTEQESHSMMQKVNHFNTAINTIVSIAQENSSNAGQVSAAIEELAAQKTSFLETIVSLQHLANDLDALSNVFHSDQSDSQSKVA